MAEFLVCYYFILELQGFGRLGLVGGSKCPILPETEKNGRQVEGPAELLGFASLEW